MYKVNKTGPKTEPCVDCVCTPNLKLERLDIYLSINWLSNIKEVVKCRKLQWYGHITRHNNLAKTKFFKEQLKEAERGVNQENLCFPTSKSGPKWNYIPFSSLSKIANCGEVCANQFLVKSVILYIQEAIELTPINNCLGFVISAQLRNLLYVITTHFMETGNI